MQEVRFSRYEIFFFSLISIIFHPVFIPFYLIISVFHLFSKLFIFNSSYLIAIFTAFFILTAIIPIIILSLFYYFKFIHSFYLKSKEERLLVSFSMTVFYFLTYYFMRNVYIHQQLFISIIILPVSSLIFSLIIIFYPKISMHAYGIGSLLGVMFFYTLMYYLTPNIYLVSALLFVSGLVITARIALKAHSFLDVFIGYLSGMAISFGTIIILSFL